MLHHLKNRLDNYIDNGSITGYVTDINIEENLKIYLEENLKSQHLSLINENYRKVALLTNMYVEEESRGQGIGTELLGTFLDQASLIGADAVLLIADTGESNEFDLINWYEEYGFVKVDKEEGCNPLMVYELV